MVRQRGQVAVSYAGVLTVVALVFVALFAFGLDARVAQAARDAVCTITGAGCPEAGGSSDNAYLGPDRDGDGVPDVRELQTGTDPANLDSDEDGVPDGDDPVPNVDDVDRDGLPDGVEVALGSDPRSADTDGDGVPDKEELDNGTDPAQGIAPLTDENRLRPWERLGITQHEWADLEEQILDEVNPGGIEGFLFGPAAVGIQLDEDGEIGLVELQENGLPVGPIIKGLIGGAKITVKQAAARAASRVSPGLAAKLVRVGALPGRVPRIPVPRPPAQPGTAFGELDALGRPTGASAKITKDMLGTGTPPSGRIRPPGYGGAAADHAKGHLIARQLGGTGDDARNLVTLNQSRLNNSVMKRIENRVRRAVEAGERVDYTVRPIYRGDEMIPRAVTISARGSKGFRLDVSLLNRVP